MDYLFDDFQKELIKQANRIGREKVKPLAAEYDREGTFPKKLIKVFAEAGFYTIYIPEEYGGIGRGILDLVLVTEEISRFCGGISLAVAATALGTFPIIIGGNEEQKKKYLPELAAGESIAAFGLTEPAAGSDAGKIQTRAVKKGDKYILNGTKVFITNGGNARINTIIASTDPERGTRGATAFIVEEGMPGFRYGKMEDKMGIRASSTAELIFEDCEVPVANRIGEEGQGFMVAMKTLDKSRPGVAAQALGIAQGAFDLACEYAKTREQFGQSIIKFQAIQFMLADMATQIEASRAMLYATSRMIDNGIDDVAKESSMCKIMASDTAMQVTTDAVQIFGGYGYMRDYPVEKMMRDAKITQIYEGTNQILRMVIARQLIKDITRHT
ncbi:MAG: acyl-CoA dehydrogenase family protein [Candidatus Electryonea clarkiae]|nr:acyl-CoA dehydrogenase family protein [Candidatus Electryonea clarkiae]MDP8287384.1 acyl-CoA dehydrogenase family protein [Candidatus Electryonea clarkiae]